MQKQCNYCKFTKSFNEFYDHTISKDGKRDMCKECYKLHNKEYRSKPGYAEYKRWYKIKKKYGLSQVEWQYRFEEQHGCCAICGMHQSELKRSLRVDHDHKTNKVRGLLCNNCNRVLGLLHDDCVVLQNALDYLRDM